MTKTPNAWRKSSYSSGGDNCVEVAVASGLVAVRDSKSPATGTLVFPGPHWTEFLNQLRAGAFGIPEAPPR